MTEGKQEHLPPGEYMCKIVDVEIEPGLKPGDLKAVLTVDVPALGAKLKVVAASLEGSSMTEAAAKKIVQYIAVHLERESAFLQPDPQTFMNDPYGLLDLIRDEAKLSPETVDAWMVEAQGNRRSNA